MQHVTLKIEIKLHKCFRMGITIFKIFNSDGISSDIRSENVFYVT